MSTAQELEGFFREYHVRFFRYAFRIVRSEDKAADLVQEAFTRALPRLLDPDLDRGVDRDRWPNYVYRTIHHLAINLVTRTREDAVDVADLAGTARRDDADAAVARVDVGRCLDGLTARARSAYLLVAFEGFTRREVAELLDLSEDAAWRLVRRAETALRTCLKVGA